MTTPKNPEPHNESKFQFPNSARVYIEGSSDIRVPMREVQLNLTRGVNGSVEQNPAVRVYDTTGPWGDPDSRCSVHDGVPALRREWIVARGDVEEYQGREVEPQDDGYLTEG
ncbi:MAG TPA: phosphomethylpyrimidine synthase, partial [Blastocatellia bacterium]|nr:phosphomethylpyrimidine synthase [Blastocatellia bacterium]